MSKRAVVKGLTEVDPGFAALVDQMFGGVFDAEEVYKALYGPDSFDRIERMSKASPDGSDLSTLKPVTARSTLNSTAGLPRARQGTLKPAKSIGPATKTSAGKPSRKPRKTKTSSAVEATASLVKAADVSVEWEGTISKLDEDKRLAFGWASIVKMDGVDVADRQGDVIDWEDLEDAAYDYMLRSRAGGNQHRRSEDGKVHKVSDVVESFVVTPEKIEKLGLPEDMPLGWWIGQKIHDDDSWEEVKSGRKVHFSVHGRGKRKALA
jgi:hypothetical protein